ncbi:GNAT family N-acetyltransferase [Cellulomonas dongxiuzhuiae]|uniref:GNAT family N-acetyltransferase n=1 Tax=Cellulomonas dongxiuzhuiae TaxID=2819979 RepID=A0ABX8GFW3_9CELL|nr:GNAT family N-acetyltransferase [Cellulomonas dongxiuzhuiae]MBO3086978.1 GNAT family N-acetyltransferase [Cellulomonas dongxiuzhuiae]MBO3093664.1 GNAT family N-acetyltransferase [Cellulomonas dongxiuzhuiae]QWC14778.1 GNAT family N-acetyltransferase [Cellulomonas dongxiuzhuiae]
MTDTIAPLDVRAAAPAHVPVPGPDLGLAWRPATVQDAARITALRVRSQEADGLPYRASEAETTQELTGEWRDLRLDTLLGFDADGTARAWAHADTSPGDERVVRAFVEGTVDPAWRGRGVGTALVAWSQARARQLLAGSGKELPARIATYCDDATPEVARVYEAAGFRPIRYYTEMRRALGLALPDVPQVDGARVVPWAPELDDAVRRAHNDVFADHWGSEPRTPEQWRQGRAMFAPTWSFVALDDADRVAGYAVSGRYEHDWAAAGFSSGYTELLGVRREWRGRRLAVALLATVMRAYADDGIEYAELDVDTENPSGAHGLYAALGYEVAHSSTMLTIEL